MPDLVKGLATAAGIPVITGMHAPGGVSVGDIAQGNMAHMNNPALYTMIRSQKWDYAVIQDNQGRFVLDSAVFPSVSLVKQGHFKIMDSVKANNSCAKIVLFAGWGIKDGMPPNGGNTGLECISRILTNYCVLNESMKETVAPIGIAWTKAINHLPAVDLWSPDEAHPSYAGSYLTASVIFSSIFNQLTGTINFDGSLSPATASNLRAFADTSVFYETYHIRFNLGGARKMFIQASGAQLSVPGNYAAYNWYRDNVWVGSGAVLSTTANGNYHAELTEIDSCVVKTCVYREIATGIKTLDWPETVQLYPNPVTGSQLTIIGAKHWNQLQILDITGRVLKADLQLSENETQIDLKHLAAGTYIVKLSDGTDSYHKKLVLLN